MRKISIVLLFALYGCATAQVSIAPDKAADIVRSLTNEERFFKLSMYGTPFFGDTTKKFLSDVPPELVRFLNEPDGTPATPGGIERIFPAGTAVRIRKIEFPSSRTMAERVLYTPRTLVWLYLEVETTSPGSPPSILVLRPGLKSEADVRAEIDRFLTADRLSIRLDDFSGFVREAIVKKQAVTGMTPTALEMAWGYPELKRIELEAERRKETWHWADSKRTATLIDGRLTETSSK